MLQDITQAELEGAEVTIDRPAGAREVQSATVDRTV
jgi:hypothetical protein